ncbi:MAG: PKD domain-containing protein [Gammaproteobacteria bacterium]
MRALLLPWLLLSLLVACSGESPAPAPLPALPQVEAGPDRIADEGTPISLQGQATAAAGRAIAFVEWRHDNPEAVPVTLPPQVNEDQLSLTLPQVEADTLAVFRFTATDSEGQSASDTVTVFIRDRFANRLPQARAGEAQIVTGSQDVQLDGCASTDPDGQIVAYAWRREGAATLLGETCELAVRVESGPEARAETFVLDVTDDQGGLGRDRVSITVLPPEANRAPAVQSTRATPQVPYPGEAVQLQVSAADPDGHPLQYQWRQLDGPFVALRDATRDRAHFVVPDLAGPATLRFEVQVSDGAAVSAGQVEVYAEPRPPSRDPDLFGCLDDPFQRGCPLAPLARVVPRDPERCRNEPFHADCPAGFLASLDPGIAVCMDNPAAPGCAALLGTLLSPSYLLEKLPPTDSAAACNPAYPEFVDYPHYWGALHEHTAYSDGTLATTPEDVFARVRAKGFDFAGISDHSDNLAIPLPLPAAECLSPRFLECILADPDNPEESFDKWEATADAVAAHTRTGFTPFRGFEWTSDRFGHANVFWSAHNLNAKAEPGYAVDMSVFWNWFLYPAELGGGDDGLLVFNHPGREDALHGGLQAVGLGDPAYTFNDFRYVDGANYRAVGVEVFGKGSEYDTGGKKGSWLGYALDQGWYLAPAGSEDHHGTTWGEADLPKTVLIARTRQAADLQEAMLARRMYAVRQQHNDLKLDFHAEPRHPMGSRLVRAPGSVVRLDYAAARDFGATELPDDTVVELMSSAADNAENYQPLQRATGARGAFEVPVTERNEWYFLRVRRADGLILAVSAPIWIRPGSEPLPRCAAL